MIIRDTPKGVGPAGPDMDETEGYVCKLDTDGNVVITETATEIPEGIIEIPAAEGGRCTYVMDSFQGILQLKLAADSPSVSRNDVIVLAAGGTGTKDPGTGTRVQLAKAREDGVAGQLLNVSPLPFQTITSA